MVITHQADLFLNDIDLFNHFVLATIKNVIHKIGICSKNAFLRILLPFDVESNRKSQQENHYKEYSIRNPTMQPYKVDKIPNSSVFPIKN